jgi:hypothetical protein
MVTPMTDARIEAFLADVLALEGENPDAVREGVDEYALIQPTNSADFDSATRRSIPYRYHA